MLPFEKRTFFRPGLGNYLFYHYNTIYVVDAYFQLLETRNIVRGYFAFRYPLDWDDPYAFQTFAHKGRYYGQVENRLCEFTPTTVLQVAVIPDFETRQNSDWINHICTCDGYIVCYNNKVLFKFDELARCFVPIAAPSVQFTHIFGCEKAIFHSPFGISQLRLDDPAEGIQIHCHFSVLRANQHVVYFQSGELLYLLVLDRLTFYQGRLCNVTSTESTTMHAFGLCLAGAHRTCKLSFEMLSREIANKDPRGPMCLSRAFPRDRQTIAIRRRFFVDFVYIKLASGFYTKGSSICHCNTQEHVSDVGSLNLLSNECLDNQTGNFTVSYNRTIKVLRYPYRQCSCLSSFVHTADVARPRRVKSNRGRKPSKDVSAAQINLDEKGQPRRRGRPALAGKLDSFTIIECGNRRNRHILRGDAECFLEVPVFENNTRSVEAQSGVNEAELNDGEEAVPESPERDYEDGAKAPELPLERGGDRKAPLVSQEPPQKIVIPELNELPQTAPLKTRLSYRLEPLRLRIATNEAGAAREPEENEK